MLPTDPEVKMVQRAMKARRTSPWNPAQMVIHDRHVMKAGAFALRLLFALIFAATALGTQGAGPEQATEIATTVHKLAAAEPPGEDLPDDVPPAARPMLTQLKNELRDLILTTVNDPASRDANTMQLTASVLQKLKTAGVKVGGNEQIESFGSIASLKIVQPEGHPELRVATTTLGIFCGDDTSLYVFKYDKSKWTVILAVESKNYAEVNGALGDFGYGISPPDERGDWFLVTKSVPPWCTSRFAEIHYRVLRAGFSPFQPIVLLNGEDSDFRDEPEKLTVSKRGFTLINVGSQSLDAGILERIHVHRYSVSGNHVTRVPPIAVIPQDFADEWIGLPWEEAERWTSTPAMDGIESWHSRLQPGTGKDLDRWYYSSEFEFVQPCNRPPSKWQIGISIDSEKRQDKLPPELFFTVSKKNGAFYMMDISQKRPAGCPGEAYPADRLNWKLLEKELNQ